MKPLAERLRPNSLDEYIGQEHLVGPGAVLRKAIEQDNIPSIILWGPPGVGKTSLAHLISQSLNRPFFSLSAVNSGVKDVRETIEKARKSSFFDRPNPILFIDEIHRFSKSQQDSLLSAVEKGIVTLIGATTENPSFEVISALLSRCQVYILKELNKEDLIRMTQRALEDDLELQKRSINIEEYDNLLRYSGGDARKLYNTLEIIISQFAVDQEVKITDELVASCIQANIARYDKGGEKHYDTISAFIKSVRGSDPNAAVYYLARMIEGGEDPKFICRRLIILAAEDIGLANPNAILIANQCFLAIQNIGMPEGRIIMSQATIYLACSPKSNSAYMAINSAQALVRETGDLAIPLAIRNAPTTLMKEIGYGKKYQYAHDYENAFVAMNFLPEELKGTVLYNPKNNPQESRNLSNLQQNWNKHYKYE